MSKSLLAALCALAAWVVLAQPVIAQEADPGKGPAHGPGERAKTEGPTTRQRGEAMVDRIVKELQLTPEQEPKVRQALETHFQAVRNWTQENGEKMRELWPQMREARQANDENKIKELQAEFKKINDARLKLREDLFKQLTGVLTPEQMEKLKDRIIEWRMRLTEMLARVANLTDEQKGKVREIVKNWREEQETWAAPGRPGRNFQALVEKIVTDVILTKDQRAALAATPAEGDFFEKVMSLDLTEQQKAQVEKIADAMHRARPERSAGPPAMRGEPRPEGPEPAPSGGGESAPD